MGQLIDAIRHASLLNTALKLPISNRLTGRTDRIGQDRTGPDRTGQDRTGQVERIGSIGGLLLHLVLHSGGWCVSVSAAVRGTKGERERQREGGASR